MADKQKIHCRFRSAKDSVIVLDILSETESSHPYFCQTYDVSDCGRPKYCETRPFSAKTNRKHSKIRLRTDTYTLGDI